MTLREMEPLADMVVREVRQDLIIDHETVHHVISITTDADVIIPIIMETKNGILKEGHRKPKMSMDVDVVMTVVVTDEMITTKVMAKIDMDMVKTVKMTVVMVRTIVDHHRDIKSIKMVEIHGHEIHVTIQEDQVHKVRTQEDWTHGQVQDRTHVRIRDPH